jgi:hypothetical protein
LHQHVGGLDADRTSERLRLADFSPRGRKDLEGSGTQEAGAVAQIRSDAEDLALEYLFVTKTPVASVYGDLERTEEGLRFTGEQRTGCIFCLFGIFMEKENRFVRLERTHPKLHAYCMDSLKLREVLGYLKVPCEASSA